MAVREYHFHDGKAGSALGVRVTPRARQNEVVEVLNDGTVRIRLTVSGAEGAANQALVDYLAEILGVPAGRIEVVAGLSGRDKLVAILDLDSEAVQQKILEHL